LKTAKWFTSGIFAALLFCFTVARSLSFDLPDVEPAAGSMPDGFIPADESVIFETGPEDSGLPAFYRLTAEDIKQMERDGIVSFGRLNPMFSLTAVRAGEPEFPEIFDHLKDIGLPVDIDYFNIVSGYGMRSLDGEEEKKMHWGIDISEAGIEGQPVYAVLDGAVISARWREGYGNTVIISHENGKIRTLYAHLARIPGSIRYGTWVKKGQIIGYAGSTGSSTGPHLHFELLVTVDPMHMFLWQDRQKNGE